MKEILAKNNQKAVDGTKMVKPFSTTNGFFKLLWKKGRQQMEIQCKNLSKLLDLFFKSEESDMKLIYASTGANIQIFKK